MVNKLQTLCIASLGMALAAMPAFAFDQKVAYDAWRTISGVEKQHSIPKGLLHSMSLVETGGGLDGYILPWPYTINVNRTRWYSRSAASVAEELAELRALGFNQFDLEINGKTTYALGYGEAVKRAEAVGGMVLVRGQGFSKKFEQKSAAVAFARKLIYANHSNMDIGLMQINWYYHGKHFGSLEEAFDPLKNLAYAVKYLSEHKKSRDWWESVGRYHSGTPEFANRYILSVWDMYQKVHRLKADKS